MNFQSTDKTLEFIFDIGLTFIPYAMGVGLLVGCGKIIHSLFREKGKDLFSRLFGLVLLLLIGAFLLIGSFLAMHEQFGFLGCAIQIPVFLFLSILILSSIMKINREKEHHEEELKPAEVLHKGEKRWKRILAAFFDLVLILAFFMAILKRPLPLFDREHLARLMKIEFLVIHSFFILGLIALPRIRIWQLKAVQWVLFFSFFSLYISASLSEGLEGVTLLLPAALATYLGALLNALSPDAVIQIVKRWIACFAIFVILSIITRMPDTVNSWGENSNVLFFGLFYFLILGILEYSGAYQRKWRLKSFRRSKNRFPSRVKESNLQKRSLHRKSHQDS